ncbi:hypothetical protein ACJMK2_005376 [Sinanodonta woodiana]|uniref:Ig-like domain-containing protein n=1 Tax=Sinanodonta woodiana TaxID=1069815 RepID=A0ABD3VQD8_SINWO
MKLIDISMRTFLVSCCTIFSTIAAVKRGADDLFFKGDAFSDIMLVRRHENVILECEVGGSPSPTIHWLRNGERITQGYSQDVKDDEVAFEDKVAPNGSPLLRLGKVKSRLFLDCVTFNEEGEYTCVAETPFKRISQSTVVKIDDTLHSEERCMVKKAIRGEPARIFLWTALRLEIEGATVQLLCRAEGYPKPEITWKDSNGKEMKGNDPEGLYEILPNGDLLIKDITWARNMGDYFCHAKNNVGRDEVSTFLYPTSWEE